MRFTNSKRLTILACGLLVTMLTYGHSGIASPSLTVNSPTGSLTSWNPNVKCTPTLVTIEQIIGNQSSPLGGATQGGSIFNPGTTSPYGPDNTKRWLTASSSTPAGWISPGQPCSITNANGQVVSAFVQINGIQRGYRNEEDWNNSFMPINGGTRYPNGAQSDTTFNIFPPGYGTCTSANTTGCMHSIHVEIDHDWKGASYCGTFTACDNNTLVAQSTGYFSLLDVQGFVFWDSAQVNSTYHNLSGWELHPLTAWRFDSAANEAPYFYLSAGPSSLPVLAGQSATSTISINTFNLFSGNVSFSTKVSSTSITAGLPPTATMTPASVLLPTGEFYVAYSTLTVTAAASSSGNYTVVVNGASANMTRSVSVAVNIADFSISASPTSLSIPIGSSGTSALALTSINGFSGNVSLSTQVTPASLTAGLSPVNPTASLSSSSVNLQPNGTNAAMLTVSTSLLTTPGTYTVTITASSGTVSHSTVVTVTVTALGIL